MKSLLFVFLLFPSLLFAIPEQAQALSLRQNWRPEFEPAQWRRSSPTCSGWAMHAGSKSGMPILPQRQCLGLFGYKLVVRSEPLYPAYLAADSVDTLDPRHATFFGEQVVIFYKIPETESGCNKIVLTLRYKNREIESYWCEPTQTKGHLIFRLVGEEYWHKGGILSYKVDLFENETLIDQWRHHLWVEIL